MIATDKHAFATLPVSSWLLTVPSIPKFVVRVLPVKRPSALLIRLIPTRRARHSRISSRTFLEQSSDFQNWGNLIRFAANIAPFADLSTFFSGTPDYLQQPV